MREVRRRRRRGSGLGRWRGGEMREKDQGSLKKTKFAHSTTDLGSEHCGPGIA